MIWEKWYSLIRGIEKGWIVPGNDADDTLKDLIINLEAESSGRVSPFLPQVSNTSTTKRATSSHLDFLVTLLKV